MYADKPGSPGRFGPLESFNYRYFTSMLRMLQMRRNYLYAAEEAANPRLLSYVAHELGRTVYDAPDAWCFLREAYLFGHRPDNDRRIRNFERWLHQRDRVGYETRPAVRIPHALKKWWLHSADHRYDYVARRGTRIGFAVDDRFLTGSARLGITVTYYDGYPGTWRLVYQSNGREVESEPIHCTGRDTFRTATLFIEADFDATDMAFDFEIRSEDHVPISFVRVVKKHQTEKD